MDLSDFSGDRHGFMTAFDFDLDHGISGFPGVIGDAFHAPAKLIHAGWWREIRRLSSASFGQMRRRSGSAGTLVVFGMGCHSRKCPERFNPMNTPLPWSWREGLR